MYVCVKVTQLCLTLCNPMDYTVHGILQARILEWIAVPFSRGSSQPRDQTQVSHIAGGFFTSRATREAQSYHMTQQSHYWAYTLIPCFLSSLVVGGSAGKELVCNAGDLSLIPVLGRSSGEGNGYPLQYSGLENSMGSIVQGCANSWTRLSNSHLHSHFLMVKPMLNLVDMFL